MARVLIISPDVAANAGGVERFCALLAGALRHAGHEVRLASPGRRTGRWAMRFALKSLIESCSVPVRLGGWEPDLMVTNGFLGGLSRRGVRVVHVFHGTMVGNALAVGRDELLRSRLRAAIGGGIAEALAARGAVNVAVSESAAREAWRYYGVRVDHVIPNGVDTAVFRRVPRADARGRLGFAPDARLALFVGRAEPGKGPLVAAETCRRAGFDLLVAGDRPIDGARHLGLIEPSELSLLYSACNCVLSPTRYEGCSYVILEALVSGVPVVTTEVGWTRTLLANVPEYGALVAPPDPGRLAAILGRLGDERIPAAVDAASDFVRAHNSLDSFGAQWLELLSSVLRHGAREHRRARRASYAGGAE
jgi:glycosyltransferase involved in cell wall biosynthesis